MQEAANMVDVYQNCFVCIAAMGASSASEGLFTQRDPLLYQPCQLTRGPQGQRLFAHLEMSENLGGIGGREGFYICLEEAALHKRGWALQERLLPSRTLNFGSILMWECREQYRDEFCLSSEFEPTLKGEFSSMILRHSAPRKISEEEEGEILRLWHRILRHYTLANLTVPGDRLVALSGVVHAIERSTGWRNIWGLWEPFLVGELLWYSLYDGVFNRTLRGPSWSWACSDLRIHFGRETDFGNQDTFLVSLEEILATDEAEPHPQVVLRLSCFPVKLKDPFDNTLDEYRHVDKELVDWPVPVNCVFDTSSKQQGTHFFVPFVPHVDSDRRRQVSGLVLAPSPSRPGAFERVGYAICPGFGNTTHGMSPPDFSASVKRQVIEPV